MSTVEVCESKQNALITGIPANSAIVGTGTHTKGLVLQVRQSHNTGSPSLTGHFRFLHGDIDSLVCQHLPLDTDKLRTISSELNNASQLSFENVREKLLDEIGVKHNAELLNKYLFKTSEWTILHKYI